MKKSRQNQAKLWAAIAIIIIIAAIGIISLYFVQQPKETIKIGAVFPLTGVVAQYGQWLREGVDLAVEEINNKGGINGNNIEIIYEDSQCEPQKGVTAMQELVNVHNTSIVLGDFCSSVTLSIAPIAEQTKTVLMASGISPKIRYAGDYVFRNFPDITAYSKEMASFTYNNLGLKRIAIMYLNTDYGVGYKDSLEKDFTDLGGEIVKIEAYEKDATDFRTQLLKIKQANPEAIFIAGTVEAGTILRQAKEMDIKAQFLAANTFENKQILDIAGEAAEGVFYTYVFDEKSGTSAMKEFQEKYSEEYGRKPEFFASTMYDAIKIVAPLLGACGENSECIKNNLYEVKDYPAVIGIINFDEYGDAVVEPILIKTVKNGEFVPYEGV